VLVLVQKGNQLNLDILIDLPEIGDLTHHSLAQTMPHSFQESSAFQSDAHLGISPAGMGLAMP
jgi:hypothetical protein